MTSGENMLSQIEASLIEAVAAVLGMEKQRVEPNENLSTYGFDSITLTQLANRLTQMFPFVRPDASTFLEYTTVEALLAHLHDRYRTDFAAHFGIAQDDVQAPSSASRAEISSAADRHSPAEPLHSEAMPATSGISGSLLLDAFDVDEESGFYQAPQPAPNSFAAATSVSVNETQNAPVCAMDIAIIGAAGRFPGADSIVELWENLFNEKNSLTEVPEDRWDWRAIFGDPQGEGNLTDCCFGGFLDKPDNFDPLFFGISPLEALQMDPQQKLVLQSTWETLENAGYSMDRLKGEDVGVYLGVQRNENLLQLMKGGKDFGPYTNIGNTHSMLANRVSYFFDWKGNSLTVDTACAASSSALHLACHALLRGEIKLALVGGVTVVQDSFSHIANRKMGLLTNEQRVCSFDENAGGYLIGEGVATALLKPLAQAEKDGDYIYGVIKGCAVTQSGKTVFLTAPDPKSHVKVIRAALQEAGLKPEAIDYIEGQGIGTELSDKAELKAYAEVFRNSENHKLGIGSTKGNIGHVESASGITSLIKVCLAMKNGQIPPVLNFQKLNWSQSEDELPFTVVAQKQAWEPRADQSPRRAGVHNFGYGGLTAHFIIEQHDNDCERQALDHNSVAQEQLLVFSSKSRPQLDRYLARFLAYVQGSQYRYFGIQRLNLADVAHTLQTGRQEMDVRLAVVACSVEELAAKLQRYLNGDGQIARLFTGTAVARTAQEKIPPALYQNQAWDRIAEHWVNGSSWPSVAGKGRRIPLPGFCFAPEPDFEAAADSIKPQLNPVDWRRFSGAFEELEDITRRLLLDRFQSWGLCRTPGEELEPERLQALLGIAPQYRRLFSLLPGILAKAGILQQQSAGRYRVIESAPVDMADLQRRSDEFLRNFPELKAQIRLTWECLDCLQDILTGKIPATRILFPDSSMERVESFYKGNSVVDYFNKLVSWQLVAAVSELDRQRPAGEKIRILEIGAGTGGTTEGVLKSIAHFGERLSYVYSDISPGFTQFGKSRFGAEFGFLEFHALNIEKDIVEQGFVEHSFDLIIACNVLHATADMDRTIQNTRHLLKSDGSIILNEVTHAQDFISLTFGLLQGWWAFADEDRRLPGGPLLNSAMWAGLLKRQGFASVEIYGQSGPEGEDSGYNVVVASNKTEALAEKPAAIADVAPKPIPVPNHNLARQVRDIFAQVLMIDAGQIDPNAAYVNFGVDSFTSLTVVKEINAAFGVQLRSTELFNFPSINEISLHIQQQIGHVAPTAQQPLPRALEKRHSVAENISSAAVDPSIDNQVGIAIIGMSGRFPHAKNIDEYWHNLIEGRDCIDDVPPGRWQGKGFWGGFVDDVDRFDPLFFNISPKEAEWMDPQQRLFVQEAWRTFEHAGYSAENLKGSRCGVYVGCRESDYLKPFAQLGTSSYQGTGNSAAMLSARIAYFLDLKGPSLSIDTACSSSLVAIHLACESINSGTCDLALAGGVSLFCTEQSHLILGKSGMLSPDGRCKTFDDSADGFVPAEAVGAVLLKPLQHALRDGDHIFGVIKAHGINQDGKTNGITASSSPSQSALQQDVYRRYRINPERIGYVEAHGTGTSLGDPIEIDALTDTFRAYTQRKQFCAIGSAKTAIGHGLAAAGVAGLIKVLLSMQHKQLPPMLHFQKENRHFQLANTPFYVNTKAQDWENASKEPLQAAISAFGFSGTNAHCVIEEAPYQAEPIEDKKSYLIPLSAKTSIDLAAKIEALADWLENEGDAYALSDIATTLLLGRSHFDFRVALVANDKQALAAALKGLLSRPDSGWTKIKPEQERGAALKQFGARLLTEIRDLELPENERDESLLSLADLYRQGYELEWRLLYQHAAAAKGVFRKVPLPTYPFVGERYWLAPKDGIAVNTQAPTAFIPVALPPETPELKAFQHAYAQVPGFCAMLLADTLHNMGVFEMPGQRYLREELRGQLQIDAKYHRLLDAFLNILLDEGYLQRQGDYFVRTGREWRLPFAELQQRKDRLLSEFSQIGAFVNLIWICARNYPEVLQGKLNATEVIFPDASFELVKGIYKDNATADFYNKILVNNVLEQVRIQTARLPGKQLKILEIGAGTGGTSALLLNALQSFGDSISYLYTDISSGFIQYGRRTYGPQYPFVSFEVLDIEKAIAPDCVFRKSFDIIVAANVIHATRDLCKTLAHVKALLKDKGYLFLNETTDIQAFATMTYGLLDGWWLFEDDIRLENSPLLDDKMWVALLQQQGFSVAPPQGLSGAEKGPGQHILIAELLEDKAELAEAAPVSEPVPTAAQPAAATKISRPVQETLKQRILQGVTDAIFHILGLNDRQLVMEKRFADYGLDSISGIDFLSLINQQFGINVRVTALFDYPSVAELSAFIYDNYREQLSAQDFADAAETPLVSAYEADDKEDESTASASFDMADMQQDDIAIIGMSGRFSGSRNVHEFWEQLASGTSCISEPPAGRWAEGGFPPGYRAGFLDGIDQFDPLFFNWSGAEAEQADPQQRLFLEESYAALEDAGYTPSQLRELTCGVFAGVGMSDYLINMRESGYFGEAQSFWGNSPAVVPARISYFLNLKGPSIAIDTACSSSLVAMHSARQSILAGECDMALAGGVYLCTTPHFHTLADKAQMLAADGVCKAFDQKADGFVFGEGVGVVVLKRLDAAIRDKDHIYGVLKASGVNQDGKTNGMTAPSTLSQTELEVAVYRRAGINPETIGYVEAHGTGTKLGDPVEIEALSKAFRRYTDKKQFCLLGSVKTNIGHSSLAAGVAGVIKVLQCFAHGQIPPLLNFSEANEHIDFNDSPFHINTRLYEWKKHGDLPRRAAISGFGLSGTNAHLVLEESPVRLESGPVREDGPVLICLSAKTEYSLKQKIRDLAACLETQGRQYSLEHIAYTLHVGREHFGQRFALVAQSREDLLRQLREADIGAMPHKMSEPSGDAELWLTQLNARGLPLPEALERLHALAALYRDGCDIDWLKLYADEARYRVPLPSYPFDRSRFWFPAPTAKALQPQAEAQTVPVSPISSSAEKTWWQPCWQPSPLNPSLESQADGPLLIFGSGQQDLSGRQNTPVVLVTSGEDFSVAPQGAVPGTDAVIRIRAGEPEDYRRLAGLLAQRGLLPTRILHCWSQQPFVVNELAEQLDRGFYSMLFIAQALIEQKACPEKIRMIYAFVRSASRDYALNQAIGSFAKTLNRENPAFYCQTLELPQAALLSQLADREYRHGTANQVEVRYRRDANGELVREVKVWRSVDLENAPAKPPALKEQGTYLLVGGAGGLGLLFCEYLQQQAEAQQNRIRVFLTGRRPLSADKLQQLQRLNSKWCEAVYLQADIANAEQAKNVVAEARSRLGGIAGIFHFAGCAQDAFLLKKTKSQCREVLAAKVQGTLCLERALAGEKVDFLSFFSSASSVTGNVGQADYAYANGFLDAFAAQGGIGGGRIFSVNWAFWRQGGMQLSDSKLETMAADMGVHGLSGAVGIQAWESILQSGLTQCMFLSGNGQKIRQFVEKQFAEPQRVKKTGNARFDAQTIYRQAESVGRLNDTVGMAQRSADIDAATANAMPPSQDIEVFLKQAVADVSRLPLDKISIHRPLDEFGLDSLMITALNEKLIARFGPLSATLFFEHRNLAALIGYLAARQQTAQPAAVFANSAGQVSCRTAAGVGDIYQKAEAIGHAAVQGIARSIGVLEAIVASSAPVRQDIEAFLKQAVADVSRLPLDKISADRPFDEFGLDSLMITALNEKLIARFGPLSATLFFEYQDLAALTGYLSGRQVSAKAGAVTDENSIGCTSCPVDAKETPNVGDIYKKAAQIGIADNTATQVPAGNRAFQADNRQDTNSVAGNSALDIAIIGVSGIYPEADNLEIFWDNLKAGRDSVTEVPPNRWNPDEYYDADRTQAMHGKMYCTKGGFVDDIDCFDAFFFNISPREAKLIDPCERLFLQTAWAAFEDAGYTRKKLAETGNTNVGVFAGISNYGYSLWGPQEWAKGNSYTPCSGLWSIANRVSYFMNLNGPSYPVDTACSSSLSAIHQACVSLNNGECSMALAGGASFNVHPHQYVAMCQGQMLSPTGKCHSFGEQGDGFVPGEGVGAVLLKPLAQAVADRDPIYAVIKGSSVNHGGRSNGYSVPNPKAQAELIKQALNKAKIDPATISYVEAHGTGTALGDPVEFEGLCRAWDEAAGQQAVEKQSCALGSVKSNIGHLGAAAGISGLTKILLQMKYKTLAPSLHAQKLNPKINFADSPFFVQQGLANWETKPAGRPRRAAISSFGAGGANAHVIVEDYALPPTAYSESPVSGSYIIPISAKTPERLVCYVEKILAFWEKHQGELQLQDFAYTLQTGREAMTERFACIVKHKQEVGMKLRAFLQHNGQAEQGNFFTGQAGDNAAQQELAASPDHEQLAKLWARGGDIDWETLFYRQQAAKRISLPTYPFDKQPYWYVEKTVAEPAEKTGRANDPLVRCTEAFDDLAELGADGLLSAFQQMGCFRQAREEYAKDRLKDRIRLSPEYDLLYDALLDILQKAGYLAIDGDRIRSTERVSQKVELHNLDYWCDKHPELAANFQLLWQCLDNMTAILQGDIPATEVMFPNASMALVERIYQQNAISDYYNQLVVDEVVSFIRERLSELPEGEKLHLLEIGAGTGGTSAAALKAIQPYRDYLRYDYTDVSLKFIQHGRKHYGHYEFVDFHVLDIEKDIERQGFARQNTDLLIATNVLHATRNMNATLKNAKSLLRREGKLIINEAVETHVFSTLTFGLLKGWWLAEDRHNRLPGSPLLNVPMWRLLLEHEGFVSVQTLAPVMVQTLAPVIETGVSQNVFVAQSDGRIPLHEEPEPREMAASSIPKPEPVDMPEDDEKLNILAQKLRHIVAAVIEVEAETINPDCAYVDMGVDSILALEIISQANRDLCTALRTTAVFDHATVNKLAAHIAAQHPGAVQQDALLDVFQQLHSGGLDIHEADRLLGL